MLIFNENLSLIKKFHSEAILLYDDKNKTYRFESILDSLW